MIKHWFKSILGIYAIEETKQMQRDAGANIEETKKLLMLNGEDEWMLNLCRKPKGGGKECLPND